MSNKINFPKGLIWFYVGIALIFLSNYLVITGVKDGKFFPVSVIGIIIILCTYIFIPNRKYYHQEDKKEEK